MLGNNKLTITSAAHHADSVILVTNGVGLTLSNSNNIVLKDITINATTGNYAVQFTGSCSNVVIRDCKLLANPTSTANTTAVISKASGTGIADSIFIINNLLNGGYHGLSLDGATGSGTNGNGTNIVIDSNIISNQAADGIYLYAVDFIRCSYNTISSRTANTFSSWKGMELTNTKGAVIGNRIIHRTTAIASPAGIYLSGHNQSNTAGMGLVANNEIMMNSAGNRTDGISFGYNMYSGNVQILHNSIYVSGSGQARGIEINASERNCEIKNNNIVMESPNAYPICMTSIAELSSHDMDCNNMYAPNFAGYAGSNKITIEAWQQTVLSDRHSVAILPPFADHSISLEPSNSDGLFCFSHPEASVDINNTIRPYVTTVGAYTQKPVPFDAMLLRMTAWENEYIEDQLLQVNVDLFNLCETTPLSTAVFGWSISGILQTKKRWTASSLIQPYEQQNVSIGSFNALNMDSIIVEVWIDSLNGQPDTIHWNDSLSALAIAAPLAEFVFPFIEDTILDLAFTVNTLIRTGTGAPASPPKMTVRTVINGETDKYDDTIAMVQNGDIWQAPIPPKYYGS
jgi:hypothetical protein